MSTKISLVIITLLLTTMAIGIYSCENSTDNPTYRGMIQGWLYDDSTKFPVTGVWVFSNEIRDTTYTNDSGRFRFESINMPRSEYSLSLTFQRNGYNNKSMSVKIKSDELYIIDSVFIKKVNK